MKKVLLFISLFLTFFFGFLPRAYALEGLSIGGHVGHVALTSDLNRTYNQTIGFGVDLGLTVNSYVDVLFQSQFSSHSGGRDGLKIFSETLGANTHLFQLNDFDFTAQFGPGFYFYNQNSVSDSKFGLHFGVGADVLAGDHLRVGLDWRYHVVFSSGLSLNYWTTMMRLSYVFTDL